MERVQPSPTPATSALLFSGAAPETLSAGVAEGLSAVRQQLADEEEDFRASILVESLELARREAAMHRLELRLRYQK